MIPSSEIELYEFVTDPMFGNGVYDSAHNLWTPGRRKRSAIDVDIPIASDATVIWRAAFDRPVDRVSIYLVRSYQAAWVKRSIVFQVGVGLPCVEELQTAVTLSPNAGLDGGLVLTYSGPTLFRGVSISAYIAPPANAPLRQTFRVLADRIGTANTPNVVHGPMVS